MSGSSRRTSHRNLQRPSSQPTTPNRLPRSSSHATTPSRSRVQGNLLRSLSSSTAAARLLPNPSVVRDYDDDNNDDASVCVETGTELLNHGARPSSITTGGLREVILRALLVDIEAAGGIHDPNFNLQTIVNRKPDVYGGVGTTLRRQVQNKTTKLKRLDRIKYLEVLNYLGVSSHALTRSFSSAAVTAPVTPARLARQIDNNTSPRVNDQLVPFETPPRGHVSTSRLLQSAARTLAMNTQRFYTDFDMTNVDIINANLECPERNRELNVLTVNDVRHDGNLYDCFLISLQVDVRDAMVNDRCTAMLVSENEVLITYPALPYPMSTDFIKRNARLLHLKTYDAQVDQAQAIMINAVRRDANRSEKRLLLRFPDDVMLGNVFTPNSYEIKSVLPMDYAPYPPIGDDARLISAQLEWRIADLHTLREATVIQEVANKTEEVRSMFESMGAATDNAGRQTNMHHCDDQVHKPYHNARMPSRNLNGYTSNDYVSTTLNSTTPLHGASVSTGCTGFVPASNLPAPSTYTTESLFGNAPCRNVAPVTSWTADHVRSALRQNHAAAAASPFTASQYTTSTATDIVLSALSEHHAAGVAAAANATAFSSDWPRRPIVNSATAAPHAGDAWVERNGNCAHQAVAASLPDSVMEDIDDAPRNNCRAPSDDSHSPVEQPIENPIIVLAVAHDSTLTTSTSTDITTNVPGANANAPIDGTQASLAGRGSAAVGHPQQHLVSLVSPVDNTALTLSTPMQVTTQFPSANPAAMMYLPQTMTMPINVAGFTIPHGVFTAASQSMAINESSPLALLPSENEPFAASRMKIVPEQDALVSRARDAIVVYAAASANMSQSVVTAAAQSDAMPASLPLVLLPLENEPSTEPPMENVTKTGVAASQLLSLTTNSELPNTLPFEASLYSFLQQSVPSHVPGPLPPADVPAMMDAAAVNMEHPNVEQGIVLTKPKNRRQVKRASAATVTSPMRKEPGSPRKRNRRMTDDASTPFATPVISRARTRSTTQAQHPHTRSRASPGLQSINATQRDIIPYDLDSKMSPYEFAPVHFNDADDDNVTP